MITNFHSLRDFCIGWYGVPLPRQEHRDPQIPPALEEYYQLLGGLFDPSHPFTNVITGQDEIVGPSRYSVAGGHIAIVLENQNCWSCRIPAWVTTPDPEVFSDAQDMLGEARGFTGVGSALSEVLITITLQEVVMRSRTLVSLAECDPADVLLGDPEPLWGPARVSYPEDTHQFWIVPESAVVAMSYGGLWVGVQPVGHDLGLVPGVQYTKIG